LKDIVLSLLRLYLEAAILLAVAGVLAVIWSHLPGRATSRLRVIHGLLLSALLFPALVACLPKATLLRPQAQVWTGTPRSGSEGYAMLAPALTDPAPTPVVQGWVFPHRTMVFLALLLLTGIGLASLRLARNYVLLGRFLNRQIPLHRVGRVQVWITLENTVAFSSRHGGIAHVVLPAALTALGRRITLAHELQHHRQGDTRFVLFMEAIKALFFWNPASYRLARWVAEIQEFACDEVLIGRQRFSKRAYGRCLLQAAETALSSKRPLVGTTGMADSSSGQFLKRRINMILNPNHRRLRGRFAITIVGTFSLMALVSFATHSVVQARNLSREEAIKAAQVAALGSGVPVDMNDLVHESMVRYTSTPEGRKHLKGALERLPRYREMIQRKIAEYGLPAELIAVPMYESGFRNDLVSSAKAAGIWQFIPQTARRYQLKVEPDKDERVNEELETDAAMRYLTDLHARFKDWRLAIKAYNEGEKRVESLIQKYASRDPWVLEKASSTEGYLAGAIATVILYKNPKLLD
jgi:membrane-bound lytic murein transglycosylase D